MANATDRIGTALGIHPLRQYALLADGERGVLLGPEGDYVWMCAPRWDSGAVFCSLVGGSSTYAVAPAGRFVWGGFYEERSLVWRSRWITGDGIVECREALAFPGDPHRAVLLRRISAVEQPSEVEVVLEPGADFDRHRLRELREESPGVWTGRVGGLRLRWSGAAGARPADAEGHRLALRLAVKPGSPHDLVLEVGDTPLPDELPDPDLLWTETETAWHRQVPRLDGTVARNDAEQAHAVLRGLTGSAGGMVAAATTSLPERAEEGRNFDYRYVWIRDQCYAAQAAAAIGAWDLLDGAVRFVSARLLADGPRTAPAYRVDGGQVPKQSRVGLPGYPGGFDLIGNHVGEQFQLDAFGESLLLLATAARRGRLDTDGLRAADTAARVIAERWNEPDAGVWELSPRRWTHSRLICAAGLRAIAAAVGRGAQGSAWQSLADRLLADASAHCLHPSGRWQRSPEDAGLDGSLLLPPLRGALPGDDPRTVATLRAYTEELGRDHFAYRYRHDERPLGEAEGAFLLCGFITALAEHQQGNGTAAMRWFERNRAACGPSGLFAEEYDVTERQLRGNLPQAFVHALMLECSARLAEPWPGQ